MTKLFVHAKLLIDGVSDTPKFDQPELFMKI